MKFKIFLFLIGVLALSQMLLYSQVLEENSLKWELAFKEIDTQITNHKNDIIRTRQEVKLMERNKNTIPTAIIEGVKDPEKKFLEFMDYLDNSDLGAMQGSYDIAAKPIIKSKPVPLQKTDFSIQFQFINPEKLESILGYLLDQQQEYPLKVNLLEIKRIPGSKPQVNLDISLLLPAKILGSQTQQDTRSETIGG